MWLFGICMFIIFSYTIMSLERMNIYLLNKNYLFCNSRVLEWNVTWKLLEMLLDKTTWISWFSNRLWHSHLPLAYNCEHELWTCHVLPIITQGQVIAFSFGRWLYNSLLEISYRRKKKNTRMRINTSQSITAFNYFRINRISNIHIT